MFFFFQVVAISVGVLSVAVGIGIPVFYENQIDNAVKCFNYFLPFIFFTTPSNVLDLLGFLVILI